MAKRSISGGEQSANKRLHLSRSAKAPLEQYRPTAQWLKSCESVIEIIKKILAQSMGLNWTVIPQGSFVQGLQLSGSDLDLVLLDGSDRWRHLNKRRNADELEMAVRKITKAQSSGSPIRVSVIQKIYHARVPLVKLRVTLRQTNQEVLVDMCFGDPTRGLCDQFVRRIISGVSECEWFVLALKVWATKRGMCETHTGGISCFAIVLLAIFHYKTVGPDFPSFFAFMSLLRGRVRETVSVETLKMRTRPPTGMTDFIHVAVPCRPMDNAARCIQPGVWVKKLLPEIKRAKHITTEIPEARRNDFDYVVSALLGTTLPAPVVERDFLPDNVSNPNHRYIFADSSMSSSSESTSEEEEEEMEISGKSEVKRTEIIDLDDFVPPVSVSSVSSSDLDRLSSNVGNAGPNARVDPRLEAAKKTTNDPITIHECPECVYFAFSKLDLDTHVYAIHEFPKKNTGVEKKEENKFRILPKFKKQVGYQVLRPRNMQWTAADSVKNNRY